MQINGTSSVANVYLTSLKSPASPAVQAASAHREAAEARAAERSESAAIQVREGEAVQKAASGRIDIYA